MSNIETRRIVGVNTLRQKIAGKQGLVSTNSLSSVDLHRLTIPKFTFDEDGRSIHAKFTGFFNNGAGNKNLEIYLGNDVILQFLNFVSSNFGFLMDIWLNRIQYNSFVMNAILYHRCGTTPQLIQCIQGQNFYTTYPFATDYDLTLKGFVAIGTDSIDCYSSIIQIG